MGFIGFVILAVVGLLLGALIVLRGVRGSGRPGPVCCARCGHDARQRENTRPSVCAECGTNSQRPGKLNFARAERRVPWVVAGILTCAASAGAGARVIRGQLEARKPTAVIYSTASPTFDDTSSNDEVLADFLGHRVGAHSYSQCLSRLETGRLAIDAFLGAADRYASAGARRQILDHHEVRALKGAFVAGGSTDDQLQRLHEIAEKARLTMCRRLVVDRTQGMSLVPGASAGQNRVVESVVFGSGRDADVGAAVDVHGIVSDGASFFFATGVWHRDDPRFQSAPPVVQARASRAIRVHAIDGETYPVADVLRVETMHVDGGERRVHEYPVEILGPGSKPYEPAGTAVDMKLERERLCPLEVIALVSDDETEVVMRVRRASTTSRRPAVLAAWTTFLLFEDQPYFCGSDRPAAQGYSNGRVYGLAAIPFDSIVGPDGARPHTIDVIVVPDHDVKNREASVLPAMMDVTFTYNDVPVRWP